MPLQKLPGQVPSPEQEEMLKKAAEYWRQVGIEAPVQAISRVEDAAKQLIGLTAALQGLYFAVFAFSDLRKQIVALSLPAPGSLVLLLFFLPIVFWLTSLFCATQVFVPKMHLDVNLNDMSIAAWQQIKQKYESIVEKKLDWLHRSQMLLVISFGAVLLVLVILALLPAPPASGPTPIIIVTPTPGSKPTP
jgi:TRAP-type C4-dicarboxylate transport system permease small subunit